MKNLLHYSAALLLLAGVLTPSRLAAQGTAFTYQGRLLAGASTANGSYDLTFALWNAASGGSLQASPLTITSATVTNGQFTVVLDFGSGVFYGPARWLEIGVRTNGGAGFTTLAPRQALTPTPYALFSANAASAAALTGSVSAGQITGTLASSNIGPASITAADLAPNAAASNLYAAGLSGVASSGLVLSTSANNTNLANAGYVKIYGSFGTPDVWQSFTNVPAVAPPSSRNSHTAVWTGTEMIVWGGYGGAYLNDGGRYNPAVNAWNALPVTAGTTPAARLNHTAVWTGSAMIVWGGIGGTNYYNDGGLYDPVLNSWIPLSGSLPNAPAARLHHTAIWTGNAMVIWGGAGSGGALNDGGVFNPGLGTWTYLPNTLAGTPVARAYHTAVWSGVEMIVWGGTSGGTSLNDGGRYNPASNNWTYVANTLPNTPGVREEHTAVWSGSQMIVWGGAGAAGDLNDGGLYDPVANAWTYLPASLANTPVARESHSAVWTGAEMMVWGGFNDTSGGLVNDGARFNPASNSWIYVAATEPNTPPARYEHTAVWTGTEMLVWGGAGPGGPLGDGGRYNPALDAWIYLPNSVANTPSARTGQTGLWTGSELVVWGGLGNGSYLNDGGRFNPALNSWTYLSGAAANVPVPRQYHTAVWTGTEMIVWGGVNNSGFLGDGGRYNPVLGNWTYLPGASSQEPGARESHTALWTGTRMIVWGGLGNAGVLNDGGLFDPVASAWTYLPASLANTPAPRASQTAVWTGSEMVVWGGTSNSICYSDGGRFNPASSSWVYLPATLPSTPAARYGQTAVWTGSGMIIWGGSTTASPSVLGDGGLFSPALNTWTSIPAGTANAPAARGGHTAVWSGSEMIVWGGVNAGAYYGDGGRYDPVAATWTYLSSNTAARPPARANHTAVWTGSQMLTWGGAGAGNYNDTYGYTPGRVLYLYQRP